MEVLKIGMRNLSAKYTSIAFCVAQIDLGDSNSGGVHIDRIAKVEGCSYLWYGQLYIFSEHSGCNPRFSFLSEDLQIAKGTSLWITEEGMCPEVYETDVHTVAMYIQSPPFVGWYHFAFDFDYLMICRVNGLTFDDDGFLLSVKVGVSGQVTQIGTIESSLGNSYLSFYHRLCEEAIECGPTCERTLYRDCITCFSVTQ